MDKTESDAAFKKVVMALEYRFGEANAITIDELSIRSGMCTFDVASPGVMVQNPRRRQTEHLLETRFADFPWLVVSSSRGYFRPETTEEIERWWQSLHGRIKSIALRLHTGRGKASASGFSYLGSGHFQKRTAPKTDLFETVIS